MGVYLDYEDNDDWGRDNRLGVGGGRGGGLLMLSSIVSSSVIFF